MKDIVIVVLLVGLILFAGLQAVQISELKGSLASGKVAFATASGSSQSRVAVQAQQAPQMVGGC